MAKKGYNRRIVNWLSKRLTYLFTSTSRLAAVLVGLACFLLWRLFDLFKAQGRWVGELD